MTTVTVPCGFGLEDKRRMHPKWVLNNREVNLGNGIIAERLKAPANAAAPLIAQPQPQEILQLRADSQSTWGLLISLGADFNPTDALPAGTDRRINAIARLLWGQGGANFTAEVDWRTGTQLVVPASFVEIAAVIEEAADPDVYLNLRVDAGIAPGAATHRAYPTRTFPQVVIPPGGEAIFPVPPFAYSFIPYADFTPVGITPGSVLTQTLGGPLATDQVYSTFVGDDWSLIQIAGEGYKLPGACRFIRIFNGNLDPGDDLPVTAMFALQL